MNANQWFAGNFCPGNATCSEGEGALVPANGPRIRTMVFHPPRTSFLMATIKQFTSRAAFFEAHTEPGDWKACEGQILPIEEYPDLFSILGTLYGGDGRTSFGLPDLKNAEEISSYYIYLQGYPIVR